VVFENTGVLYMDSLVSLPPGIAFRNSGDVSLKSITSIPNDVVFENGGNVFLESLTGDWFVEWKGNIEGLDSKMLLNKMIKDGLFER